MRPRFFQPRVAAAIGAVVMLIVVVLVARHIIASRQPKEDIPLETIARRDIAQTVEATGTVAPVEIVEIKSKASGQIIKMPVEIGSVVKAADTRSAAEA